MNPETVLARLESLPPGTKIKALAWARREIARARSIKEYPTPADLMVRLNPSLKITPALELISRELAKTLNGEQSRLIISLGPQEGKSNLVAIYGVLYTLMHDRNANIIVASYSRDIAEKSVVAARNLVTQFGSEAFDSFTGARAPDVLGFALDKATAAHWTVKDFEGSVVAVGIGGSITGRKASVLICDDLLKGSEEADSPAELDRILNSFKTDLHTRLAAGGPIIIIATRWSENDPSGWLIANEPGKWKVVNIPAISEEGVDDALGRPPGVWLESAQGRTTQEWEHKRGLMGSRWWSALYQGRPVPPEGGNFNGSWFSRHRIRVVPKFVRTCVAIDPAETGERDEVGLVAIGIDENGIVIPFRDESARMTPDVWAKAAVDLAVEVGATELIYEAYVGAKSYGMILQRAWDDNYEGYMPFRLKPSTGSGNAKARAAGLSQACENGSCRMDRYVMAEFERQAVSWFGNKHCPDRVTAVAIGFEHLARSAGWESVGIVDGYAPLGFVGPDRSLADFIANRRH